MKTLRTDGEAKLLTGLIHTWLRRPESRRWIRIAVDALRAERELQLAETGECDLEVLVEELLAILCQRLTLEGKALHIAKEQIALQLQREARRRNATLRRVRQRDYSTGYLKNNSPIRS